MDLHQHSGNDTSLAFDQAGRPAISHVYDGAAYEVRVARWDGAAWATQTVDTSATGLACTSLAVDPTGAPQLTYIVDKSDVRHARWNGATWDVETAAPGGRIGGGASIALDGAGRPHLAYCDAARAWLRYAYWDGAAWHLEDVDAAVCTEAGYAFEGASIALDGSGNPHIAYATPGATDQTLRHARRVGGLWQGEAVRTAESFTNISLALDGAGTPQLAYREKGAGVKHSYWTGTAWRHRTFDSDGKGPSLALDGTGKAHIACYNRTDKVVKYGRWNGTSFVRETVGAASGTAPVSLRLDAAGNPAIAFTRGKESEQLLLARKTGSSWAIQTAFESGSFNFIQSLSLALDPAGNPGIAARCWGTGLHYARLAGGAWVAHGVDTLNKATDGVSHAIGADGKALIAYGSGKLSALMLATQVDAETGGMRRHLPRR